MLHTTKHISNIYYTECFFDKLLHKIKEKGSIISQDGLGTGLFLVMMSKVVTFTANFTLYYFIVCELVENLRVRDLTTRSRPVVQ